jgi:hypothetical protein
MPKQNPIVRQLTDPLDGTPAVLTVANEKSDFSRTQ